MSQASTGRTQMEGLDFRTNGWPRHVGIERVFAGKTARQILKSEKVGIGLEIIQSKMYRSKKLNENGCWIWLGKKIHRGYGIVDLGNDVWHVHRLSWTIYNNTVPKGLYVCHQCDTPACFNPAHLFLGTPRDNVRDMVSKGRGSWQR